jgi:hypothetical protein
LPDPKEVLRNAYGRKQHIMIQAEKCDVAMLTVMELQGWDAKRANEILGAKVFAEPEEVPDNGKAD